MRDSKNHVCVKTYVKDQVHCFSMQVVMNEQEFFPKSWKKI